VEFGPNLPDVLNFASYVFACSGRAEEAIGLAQKAMSLSPNYPPNYLGVLGNALRLAGRREPAMEAFRAYHAASPGFGLADIAIIQEQAGRIEEARQTARQLVAARPDFTVSSWARMQFRSDAGQMAADMASLRSAGIPD
jgi:adenylate cyclase